MRTIFLTGFLILSGPALAQRISVYATLSSTRVSVPQEELYRGIANPPYSYWTTGVGGGVSVKLFSAGPIQVAADGHGTAGAGDNRASSAFGGLRLALDVPRIHIKPYVEASYGYFATKTGNSATKAGLIYSHGAAYELLGGLDLPLAPHLDLRLVQVGVGSAHDPNTFPAANYGLLSVASGIVVHI